jgi:hypothetical protein
MGGLEDDAQIGSCCLELILRFGQSTKTGVETVSKGAKEAAVAVCLR